MDQSDFKLDNDKKQLKFKSETQSYFSFNLYNVTVKNPKWSNMRQSGSLPFLPSLNLIFYISVTLNAFIFCILWQLLRWMPAVILSGVLWLWMRFQKKKKRKWTSGLRTLPNRGRSRWGSTRQRQLLEVTSAGGACSLQDSAPDDPGKKSGVHPSRRKRRPLNLSRKLLSRADTTPLLCRASPISGKQLFFFITAPPLVNDCDFLFKGDEQLLLLTASSLSLLPFSASCFLLVY